MIKLNGSRFTAATPENLKTQPEVQAIAYAVGRQIEKLLAYADGARPTMKTTLSRSKGH